jgi:lipopolysaccharide transport system permease protein
MKRALRYRLDLLAVLTQKELKVRYKSSFLGYLWSVANPLAMTLVFFLAFKVIMRIQIENFMLFLIAGLFPWQWFSNSVGMAPGILLANSSLIKKVSFPRDFILLTMVVQDMLHYLFAVPVLVAVVLLYGIKPTLAWLYGFPILLALQFLLTYGVSLIISSVNLFFRDLERLTQIFLMLLFYATPIFYSENMVPVEYRYLLKMNPLSPLIVSWRNLYMSGTIDFGYLIETSCWALFVFVLGKLVFKKLSSKFAEVL